MHFRPEITLCRSKSHLNIWKKGERRFWVPLIVTSIFYSTTSICHVPLIVYFMLISKNAQTTFFWSKLCVFQPLRKLCNWHRQIQYSCGVGRSSKCFLDGRALKRRSYYTNMLHKRKGQQPQSKMIHTTSHLSTLLYIIFLGVVCHNPNCISLHSTWPILISLLELHLVCLIRKGTIEGRCEAFGLFSRSF